MRPRTVTFARVTIAATGIFVAVMFIAFPLIQPELNPLHRFGSEYAVGRMGWLMKGAFFCWGTGFLAFALAMAGGLDPEARSRIGISLFLLAAVGLFLSGVFDSDLQVRNVDPPPLWVEPPPSDEQEAHALAGIVAFFAWVSGAGLVSRRLRLAGRLRGPYRWLRYLSWLMPLALVAMVLAFIPRGLAGLGQRIFLALTIAWLVLAAHGLATGAFSPGEGE